MDLYGSAVGAGNAVRSDASSAAAWPNRRRHSITLLGAFPVSAATVQTIEKPSGGEHLKRSSRATVNRRHPSDQRHETGVPYDRVQPAAKLEMGWRVPR